MTSALVVAFFIGALVIRKAIRHRMEKRGFDDSRARYTTKFLNFLWGLVLITIISMVWDVSFQGLSIYFASMFTVIGVACFAQWSILSNITAAIILFFNHSYKIGTHIQVIDGDNSVSGKVVDIRPFHFLIKTETGEIVCYPNNLIIQKPVKQLKDAP
jgi:small-conductance mechanosensitive channel